VRTAGSTQGIGHRVNRARTAGVAAALAAALALGACASTRHLYNIGQKEMAAENYDRAVLLFS